MCNHVGGREGGASFDERRGDSDDGRQLFERGASQNPSVNLVRFEAARLTTPALSHHINPPPRHVRLPSLYHQSAAHHLPGST
jgi:hypothetical protein